MARVARAWAELMSRLGYERYGAQGGDTGSVHLTDAGPHRLRARRGRARQWRRSASRRRDPAELADLSEAEQARLARHATADGGRHGVRDHPVDPAADAGVSGSPTRPPDSSPGSSRSSRSGPTRVRASRGGRRPRRDAHQRQRLLAHRHRHVVGAALQGGACDWGQRAEPIRDAFRRGGVPGDFGVRAIAERENNVVHWSEFERGGHFAAMEVPDLLVGDVRTFFRGIR